ncbi:MAG: AcrB/AcrD/AcrF family protein [Gammaproteobacteria bacterium]|nr:MAG: AcrB/AcrD/AcrF family protein [Gammaproteobacteria bacterium]
MYRKLLGNSILVNLTFLLVIVAGWFSYTSMPREQDPSVNFNWLVIWTGWPGASAEDVEKRVTDLIEVELGRISNIRVVSSTSRHGASNITVRFEELEAREFDKRIQEVRRAIQRIEADLPEGVRSPMVLELTSSNTFPTAVVTVSGLDDNEQLRHLAQETRKDLLRLPGVDRVDSWGMRDPELRVEFDPGKLIGLGISPKTLADTVKAYFHDAALGNLKLSSQEWLVRLQGTSNDPGYLEGLPLVALRGEVPLRSVARVRQGREKARQVVFHEGKPAVMFSLFKSDKANNLELLERVKAYIAERNPRLEQSGVQISLAHDQTIATRNAIHIMENNALIGLLLVAAIFLGGKIALFTGLGLVFSLAGTFWVLHALGETLNVTVLLGIVIVLGMLVDDAVVVVEAIHANLKKGMERMHAAVSAVREMWVPVSAATLTTMAAFLPLMLMPGILGQFMRVVPLVVSVALAISLIEAFWLLPAHVIESRVDPNSPGRLQHWRDALTRRIRHAYTRRLLGVMRHPGIAIGFGGLLAALCLAAVLGGVVKVNFFANDLFRFFYVNVNMPPDTSLAETNATLQRISARIREAVPAEELNNLTTMAGMQLTEKEPHLSSSLGQIMVSLPPAAPERQSVDQVIEAIRQTTSDLPGPTQISFLRRKTGPPSEAPVSVKLRGDDIGEVRDAVARLEALMRSVPGIRDIDNDDVKAGTQLSLQLEPDAILRAGLNPADVANILALYVDGLVVADMRHEGETWDVRIKALDNDLQDVKSFLAYPVGLPSGKDIPLGQLVKYETRPTEGNIRHQDFRRTLTITADLDTEVNDTVNANRQIRELWKRIEADYPGVTINFSGELDDIKESLDSMALLFLLGLGLIYMILGTQFRSYVQPLLILATVPMAFTGVVIGLLVSNNPLSLVTLYGIIALAGIAANDAIVLISTANRNLEKVPTLGQAIVFASRRRVLPILITSLTTMAGLFSLAAGWGGESLIWGPVATAIVWGLAFSTLLTLFIIPPLYALVQRRRLKAVPEQLSAPPPLGLLEKGFSRALARLRGQEARRELEDLEAIATDDESAQHYETGRRKLLEGKVEEALWHFEQLARSQPENFIANLYTAQAMVQWMQHHGWDVGYTARASRYLRKARRLRPGNTRVREIELLLKQLDGSAPQEFPASSQETPTR